MSGLVSGMGNILVQSDGSKSAYPDSGFGAVASLSLSDSFSRLSLSGVFLEEKRELLGEMLFTDMLEPSVLSVGI